jgi:hypothetical protein
MSLLPPDYDRPYKDAQEREEARRLLAQRDRVLTGLQELAGKPTWSEHEQASLPRMTNGMNERPEDRLKRWKDLFGEELAEVHRLAEARALSDIEMRQAVFLAKRLLVLATDRPSDTVDTFQI